MLSFIPAAIRRPNELPEITPVLKNEPSNNRQLRWSAR
jgi:hypothetical protein